MGEILGTLFLTLSDFSFKNHVTMSCWVLVNSTNLRKELAENYVSLSHPKYVALFYTFNPLFCFYHSKEAKICGSSQKKNLSPGVFKITKKDFLERSKWKFVLLHLWVL